MNRAEQMFAFIDKQLASGRTCYLSTALRVTKLTAKHRDLIRVRNGALEIRTGKRWTDYTYTSLRAS
jgi:hypothetical protein